MEFSTTITRTQSNHVRGLDGTVGLMFSVILNQVTQSKLRWKKISIFKNCLKTYVFPISYRRIRVLAVLTSDIYG